MSSSSLEVKIKLEDNVTVDNFNQIHIHKKLVFINNKMNDKI